ncbi:hypothetical protein, unlikely [Trypanosoma brucei gambiense DAL972]|uniref:T. brucei spp.-specific protein n=1 Tax=Trypanosoma brucei gambiense (strain MHOM/CI/86/DAL972) TaxID=679716 RepID=C9ZXF1_TRYB9|nr:hypothetical protein, unlikely [Trypanosoma brucei gambiense DAL972]CBH14095.1 hypothetical protein, unlikely [Trypanosoma brucei gambiense DAL972]|eukprot:XP_011776366.1 hypothetical protein, unlikely [Trypanosoma brucei gambiense DAL972]
MVSPTGIFFFFLKASAVHWCMAFSQSVVKGKWSGISPRSGEGNVCVCVCVFSPHRIQLMKVAFLLAFIGNNCGISVRSASCRLWFSDLHCVNTVPVHLRKEAHLWRP